jgi:hypothetical protein
MAAACLAAQPYAAPAAYPSALRLASVEKFYLRRSVRLDAENMDVHYPEQDFADASAALDADRSAVVGCLESCPALVRGCPCESALADEPVVWVAPDAEAHPLLGVHSLLHQAADARLAKLHLELDAVPAAVLRAALPLAALPVHQNVLPLAEASALEPQVVEKSVELLLPADVELAHQVVQALPSVHLPELAQRAPKAAQRRASAKLKAQMLLLLEEPLLVQPRCSAKLPV